MSFWEYPKHFRQYWQRGRRPPQPWKSRRQLALEILEDCTVPSSLHLGGGGVLTFTAALGETNSLAISYDANAGTYQFTDSGAIISKGGGIVGGQGWRTGSVSFAAVGINSIVVNLRDQGDTLLVRSLIDQENVYRQRNWSKAVALYICPSQRYPEAKVPPLSDEYGDYHGGGWAWGHIDYAANAFAIPNRPLCLGLRRFTDGTSNTVLVGEKAMNPRDYLSGTWYWDEPFFLGGSGGTQRGFGQAPGEGTTIVRDSTSMGFSFRYNWGSAHPAGAQFLFADGSLRQFRYGLANSTVQAMLTPGGGEVVSEP